MLNFKRSLVIIVGLLLALCVTACGGAAKPTSGVASQGDTNNNAATVVPTAQPQATAASVNVQAKNQPQATPAQTTNNGNQQQAQTANSGNQQQTAQNNTAQGAQSDAQAGNQNTQNGAQNNSAPATNSGGANTIVASTQVNVNGQMQMVLTTGTGMTLYYRTSDPAPGSTCTGACAQAWPPFIVQGNLIPTENFQGQLTVHTTANGNQAEYNGHPLYTYNGDKAHEVNGQGLNGVWNAVTILPQKQHW